MDDSAVDVDMFSSLDDELISDIKRPSLISLSSEDSMQDKTIPADDSFAYLDSKTTSTPFKVQPAEFSPPNDCNETGDETADYLFKVPPNFSLAKRYSLSIFNENPCAYNMNKSSSMLDVSSISSFSPLRRDSCMYSNETLQSNSIATTKSKDSGFQRSTSCTSLTTTSSKKYDHVQSKVKQYIQTIKQSEALRKMQKRMESNAYREAVENSSLESPDTSPISDDLPVSKKDLLNKVKELEEELKERDCVIEQLEKNQSELRLKYAAAENQIDDLRIRASQNDDSTPNYITDEKVAELLMSNAKNSRRSVENGIAKQLLTSNKRDKSLYEFSPFARPASPSVRELQPIKKFGSSSIRLNDNYPVLKLDGLAKSASCKYVSEHRYELSKSASNIDKPSVRFTESNIMNLPYEKNSFAKVQQWQRSLVNLDRTNDDRMDVCSAVTEETNDDTGCCMLDESTDEAHHRKSRRYLKNKDADKKRNRSSYPVGCKCEKFKKCKSKEEVNTPQPAPDGGHHKFRRTVSFATYEDSMTSSVYDDGDSSSGSSDVLVPRQESFKDYKQRKLQEKFGKYGRDGASLWNEIKKAKSASNIHREHEATHHHRSKRLIDNGSSGYEHSCSDRKHCSKSYNKKYRKLDDCNKIASSGCNALVKCRSAHACRASTAYDVDARTQAACLSHSKSFDEYGRRYEARDSGHRLDKLECSCLVELENLKIQEHHALVKFAEHLRKHPRKVKEKDAPLGAFKRYSLQK